MKTKLIGICILLLGSHAISAQSKQPRAIIGLGFGVANIMDVKYDPYPNSLIDWSQCPLNDAFSLFGSNWTIVRSPTLIFNTDWRVDEKFGLGFGFAYDQGTMNYRYDRNVYEFVDFLGFPLLIVNSVTVLHYQLDFQRLNVGCRGLYYFRKNERNEMYTGLRSGLTRYTFKRDLYTIQDGGKHRLPPTGVEERMQIQLILMGWNVNLMKDFLLQFEIAVGQPNSLALNLGYRL